jgi:DNA-binding Lrp family transcriptional regulator
MSREGRISKKEKCLLNEIGKNANLSYRDILSIVGYKRENIISKKIRKLRELDILRGPYYDINLGAVGKNQIYNIYADMTYLPEDRDLVFSVAKHMLGVLWIFPVQQEDRFFTQFQCNHYSIIGKLLKFLAKKKLITYRMVASKNRWIKMNPNFFGPPIPDARTLSVPCTLPDISYSCVNPGIIWNRTDLIFMQYLQARTDSKPRIREIEYKEFGRFWTYDQIQHSFRKIVDSKIIQSKDFYISPYPRSECCTFVLLLEASQKKSLLRVMHNFGKGCRIHKSYTMAGDFGFLFCWASTKIMPEIIELFDTVSDITTKGVYYLRTHKGKYLYGSSFEAELFNVQNQRWEFPYLRVKKEIENLIEEKREKK